MALRRLRALRDHLVCLSRGTLQVAASQPSETQLLARRKKLRVEARDLLEQVGGARRLPGVDQERGQVVLAFPLSRIQDHSFLQHGARFSAPALLGEHLSEGCVSGREIRRDLDGAPQLLLGGGQVPLEKSYLPQGQISLAAVRVKRERGSEFGNGLVFLAR